MLWPIIALKFESSMSTVFGEALETKGETRSGGGARWLWALAGSILLAALQPFPPAPLGAAANGLALTCRLVSCWDR